MNANEIVFGKFRLEEKFFETDAGEIYRGVQTESGQPIIASAVYFGEFLTRFELIAEKLRGLDSPYAASFLDFGEHEGQAIVVQEYVEGQTLAAMLVDSHGLPENMVIDITEQIAKYLQELHQANLVHGSLNLENILLSSKGIINIRDAGFAQGINLAQLLKDGELEPTSFFAPELRIGGELNAGIDFYALGAILYKLLTGEALELEPTDLWPGNKKPGLVPEIDELAFKCLQADPERRIQSAAELLNGVAEARRGSTAGAQDTILGMEDVLVGHTLGAYQLVERLGQGGMATVYKAYEPALDRYVAIKVLPQFFAKDPNFMSRFRREAKAVAQLNHPSIMPIYSFGEEGDITYIAMQYVPGGTLKQGRGQVYEPAEAIRLALPIVRALAYAHQRGIVHRDIKPSNVLLGEEDWPVLADFGLAKMAEASQQLTGTGVGVGTPMYMSPEQGQGSGVDYRTDIYSMGIMLYEMLTGDVPFRADTPMAVVIKHMTAPLPMPRDANSDIPETLERVILKATSKSPDDRFQTAEEMIEALERAQHSLLSAPKDEDIATETVAALREPAAPVRDAESALKKGIFKKVGLYLGAVIGVLIVGLLLMWALNICPPDGPWPIPPWCEGTKYILPTIGGEDEAAPTPAITEGTLGGILFQDDFEGEISSRWQFTSLPGLIPWAAEEIDGRTVMHSIAPDSQDKVSGAEIRETDWENYAIQYDFRFAKPDEFGVNYFVIESKLKDCPPTIQSLQAYRLTVSSEKTILGKSQCVTGSDETLLENDKDIDPNEWHTMQFIFIGNRIQVIIDGETFMDLLDEDPLESGGDIWLSIYGGAEIYVDNLKVYEIIPGEGSGDGATASANVCASGETLLLYEDFESGISSDWVFSNANGNETGSWEIVDDGDGNRVMVGQGHSWAVEDQSINHADISFRLRLREQSSTSNFHINFRSGHDGRYYVSTTALMREIPNEAVADFDAEFGDLGWHDLEIRAIGASIQVFLDNELIADYEDDNPLPDGGIAIENTDGTIWYDDIVVCVISAEEDAPVSEGDSDASALGDSAFDDIVVATKRYEDGFDDEAFNEFWFPGNLENWRIEDVDGERAIIGSGPMRFGGEAYALKDFQLDIDFNFNETDAEGNFGALFGIRSGDCSGYLVELFAEGGGLIKMPCSGEQTNNNFAYPEALNPGEWHHLQVRMVGNHIRILVEDNLILDVTDEGELIDSGEFAFWAQDSQAITYFDNFSLQELTYTSEVEFFLDSGQRLGDRQTLAIAAADVDGDGDDDLVSGVRGHTNLVWKNTGEGLFLQSFETSNSEQTYGVSPGDFDLDGDLDLFFTNYAGPSEVWLNDGQWGFEQSQELSVDGAYPDGFGMDAGDLDGDGDLDVWIAAGGQNLAWLNDGAGGFAVLGDPYPGKVSVGVALGVLVGA
ncbi:MAG: protein kinase, partial [Chloroflexi bacterium]|nr:protein kinase [Chloroflexota bacterium]